MKKKCKDIHTHTRTLTLTEPWNMAIDPVATGKSLRQKRREAGLTQEELSFIITEYCDYPATPVTISYWETGKRAMNLAHAVFLAILLNCRLDELVVSIMRSHGKEQEDDRLVPFAHRIKVSIYYPKNGLAF